MDSEYCGCSSDEVMHLDWDLAQSTSCPSFKSVVSLSRSQLIQKTSSQAIDHKELAVEMREGKFFMRNRVEGRNAAASSDNPMRSHQP